MTRALLLATNPNLTRHAESLPGHVIITIDSDRAGGFVRSCRFASLFDDSAVDTPELVIIGDGMPVDEALAVAGAIGASCADAEIVLVAKPEADLILRAMRAGIRGFIPPSIGPDELKVLMHRVGDTVRSRARARNAGPEQAIEQGRIVVVTSPNGGSGKSTIASNIAVALARTAPMETVLVDLDLQFGDIATMLNLTPLYSVADAFGSAAAVDTLILKSLLSVHPYGFYVLCGAASSAIGANVSGEQVAHLLQQLSAQFRYVVVDTSSGLDLCAMAAIGAASDVVLISTMGLASASAMRKDLALLTELDLLGCAQHIVLNLAERRSGMGIRQIESALGLPVDIVVPRAYDALYAGSLGEALLTRQGSGHVAKAIYQLVARIHADAGRGNNHHGIGST